MVEVEVEVADEVVCLVACADAVGYGNGLDAEVADALDSLLADAMGVGIVDDSVGKRNWFEVVRVGVGGGVEMRVVVVVLATTVVLVLVLVDRGITTAVDCDVSCVMDGSAGVVVDGGITTAVVCEVSKVTDGIAGVVRLTDEGATVLA